MENDMTPDEIAAARNKLGLSVRELAELVDTDPQSVRRMEMREDASTFRRPPPRFTRLVRAYLEGYRPSDWPRGAR